MIRQTRKTRGLTCLTLANLLPVLVGVVFAIGPTIVMRSQPALPLASGAESPSPTITKVDPANAGPGSNIILTIKGQNFVQGARIAFSNPKITVVGTTFRNKSELKAHVQIAADAATGSTGLFVVNPDQNEAEGYFEVSGAAINNAPSTPAADASGTAAKSTSSSGKAGGKAVSFSVFNVGDVVQVLKTKSKIQGTLSVDKGMLSYVENGKQMFSVPVGEVQEVGPNMFFGMNTGTFHIYLSTGQRYNFSAASLNPTDTQKIETQLQAALK
jgi:IPT/TIG domain